MDSLEHFSESQQFLSKSFSFKAGLRAVHDLGPEIRRAISGNLDEEEAENNDGKEAEEPNIRVSPV